jgi:hypothetical protein
VRGARGSGFVLDGLLVAGRSVRVEGDLDDLVVRHCTLVPGWGIRHDCEPRRPGEASLELVNTPQVRVTMEHSISGPVHVLQDEVESDPIAIRIRDSVLDAADPAGLALGAPGWERAHAVVSILRCTVLGAVHLHALELAENSIFTGPVNVARRQQGCMRFCYVHPPGSRTPRRFRCQPDLVERTLPEADRPRAREHVRPVFNSVRYGTPTYCQLANACPTEITAGADDESEMGVFHDLFDPQRAINLRVRLDEYTPAGSQVGAVRAS